MPVYYTPVKEFTRHILDPLVQTRLHNIINSFNLQSIIKDNIHIKYGFSASKSSKDVYKNITIRDDRLDVEVDTNMNPQGLKWENTNFKMSSGYGYRIDQLTMDRAIFIDPDPGVHIHLHETPCNVTINMNLTVKSRTIAYMVLSQFYNLYHGEDNTWMFTDFMYDLPVNRDVISKLYDIYKMREFDTKQLTFPGYIFAGSQCAINTIVNRQGTRKEFVLRRHRINLIQEISMSVDKPQENNDNNGTFSYTIPMQIVVQFSRPDFYTLIYPITIMNKLIPARHMVSAHIKNETLNNVDFIKTQVERYTYEYWENEYKHFVQPFVSPYFDDWRPSYNSEPRNYTQRPFWIITATLDENDDGTVKAETVIPLVGDIIDKFHLHPIVEEIIGLQGCRSYDYDCLFNIEVYKNNSAICPADLSWDEDERAVVIPKNNKIHRYHIVISEMMDLNFLNPDWDWLRDRYKEFFDKSGKTNPNDTGVDNGTYISKRVFYGDIIPLKETV